MIPSLAFRRTPLVMIRYSRANKSKIKLNDQSLVKGNEGSFETIGPQREETEVWIISASDHQGGAECRETT